MCRIVAHCFGPPDQVLTLETVTAPTFDPESVVVRMVASPINPSDLITISGAYQHRVALPFVPGFEGVGVVKIAGDAVSHLRAGQRVLPLGSAGNWQTTRSLPADWCVVVPDDIGDDQAALAYINPLTARLMVRRLSPNPGALIGLNAATSVIGRMLVRMLHASGARPVAVVRSRGSMAALAGEPVEDIILEGAPLPALAGGLDAVGGLSGARLAGAVQTNGLMLHYGLLSGQPLTSDLLRQARASVQPFWLRSWVHEVPRAELHAAMTDVFADIRSGRAASAIAGHYPLAAFREALAHTTEPSRQGKIIFRMTDGGQALSLGFERRIGSARRAGDQGGEHHLGGIAREKGSSPDQRL